MIKAPLEMLNEILTSRGPQDEKTIAFARKMWYNKTILRLYDCNMFSSECRETKEDIWKF
jgi:hypothetical protein